MISSTSRSPEWATSAYWMPGGWYTLSPGAQHHLADVLAGEADPAAQHLDELEAERVGVPVRRRVLARYGADHVCAEGTAGHARMPRSRYAKTRRMLVSNVASAAWRTVVPGFSGEMRLPGAVLIPFLRRFMRFISHVLVLSTNGRTRDAAGQAALAPQDEGT